MTDKSPARKVKTPEARALEQVAILQRRLGKVKQQKALLERQARDLDPDISAIQARLDYAKASPDLPAPANIKTPGAVA